MKRGSLWDTPHSTSLNCSLTSAECRNVHNCLPCMCTSFCGVLFKKLSGQITWCVRTFLRGTTFCMCCFATCMPTTLTTKLSLLVYSTCTSRASFGGKRGGGVKGGFCSPSAGIGLPWNLYMLAHQLFRLSSPKCFNTQFLFPLNE